MEAIINHWYSPRDFLPKKPCKRAYEYVDCEVKTEKGVFVAPWNCEHQVFDDEHYDDFQFSWKEVLTWRATEPCELIPTKELIDLNPPYTQD